MHFSEMKTNEEILLELGNRIRDTRIGMCMCQTDLAHRAGVSPKTVARIENGENIKIGNILRVLRVLRRIDALDLLLPVPEICEVCCCDGMKKRERASRKMKEEAEAASEKTENEGKEANGEL